MKALGPDRIDQLARSAEAHLGLEDFLDKQVEPPARPDWRREVRSFLLTFVISLALILLLRIFVIQNNTVVGSSMVPTLAGGDQILVEKISSYLPNGIQRGDIVTVDTRSFEGFAKEERRIIKRVIGLPGERVTLLEGRVYVDGQLLEESYLDPELETLPRNPVYSDLLLGADEFYIMGDNRTYSMDSRAIGPVARSHIVGSLCFRFYPFSKMGKPK